jgi:hypothetical protein
VPAGDDKSELATPKYHCWSTARSCNVAAHHPDMFPSICKSRVTMSPDKLARAARNLAHPLGLPVYIRNGRIYQHGPGVEFSPPNGVCSTVAGAPSFDEEEKRTRQNDYQQPSLRHPRWIECGQAHRTPSIRLIAKTGEIIENAGDQLSAAQILSLRCGSKKLDQISRFLCNLRPAG